MVLQVVVEVTALFKALVADATLEGGHVGVCSHVLSEVHGLAESLVADDTAVWFHL